MTYLDFEKRGCNFHSGDYPESDIGNHRITTPGYTVPLKDGRLFCFEFIVNDKYRYRTENKRTGAKLKKPVKELVLTCAAFINTSFENERGTWRDCNLERDFRAQNVKYTEKAILEYINSISAIHYDGVRYV